MLGPDQFLPLAEETGLLGYVGETILRDGLAQLARWRARNLPFANAYLSVNVGTRQVVDPTFAKTFPGNVVNWQTALDMEGYAESPNHEAEMPNYVKAQDDYTKVFSTLPTTEGLDLDKTITDMVTTLQTDFDAAP